MKEEELAVRRRGAMTLDRHNQAIKNQIDFIQAPRVISGGDTDRLTQVLQCLLPAPPEETNLCTRPQLAEAFPVPEAAVALGTCIVKTHFTLSRGAPGPDSGCCAVSSFIGVPPKLVPRVSRDPASC